MLRPSLAVLLVTSAVGCHHTPKRCDADCPPERCAEQPTTVVAPRPQIEVQSPGDVVVRAPQQKIVVETPPAPPPQAPQYGMPMAAPMPAMGMGYGYGAAPVTMHVRERSGIGFALDFIRIPIPWPRLISVQRPAEVSYQMPVQYAAPAAPVMMPMGYAPPMMPMGYGAQVMPAGYGMAAPAAVPVPVTGMAVGTGQMVVQGQAVVQGQGMVVPPAAAPAPQQDRLRSAEQQLSEVERLCEELRKLKQQPERR